MRFLYSVTGRCAICIYE